MGSTLAASSPHGKPQGLALRKAKKNLILREAII